MSLLGGTRVAVRDPDPDTRQVACWALSRVGAAAAPLLAEHLGDGDVVFRRQIAAGLAAMGPEARSVADSVTAAMADPDQHVRKWAAEAVGSMQPEGRQAEAAVRALRACLVDEHAVRLAAARTLAVLGPVAAPAFEDLCRVVADAAVLAGSPACRASSTHRFRTRPSKSSAPWDLAPCRISRGRRTSRSSARHHPARLRGEGRTSVASRAAESPALPNSGHALTGSRPERLQPDSQTPSQQGEPLVARPKDRAC